MYKFEYVEIKTVSMRAGDDYNMVFLKRASTACKVLNTEHARLGRYQICELSHQLTST